MYNTDLPLRAELPTARRLLRSTAIAAATAGAILVTIVLPAEYAIDPTGIGRVLGLTEMGEIKAQLAREAEDDRRRDRQRPALTVPPAPQSSLFGRIVAELLIRPAAAQQPAKGRSDTTVLTLQPGEGIEVKLAMKQGARADFSWTVTGGVVNFDMHADGDGSSSRSYEKGRAVPNQEGVLTAAFEGMHGWFWRNRGRAPVTLTLRTSGDYSEVKRM